MRASAESDAPRRRIQEYAETLGQPAFALSCARILDGQDADAQMLRVLAGRSASWFVSTDDDRNDYWQRVWAARGLLWAWHEDAVPSLVRALDDEAWRVREMALKVAARHRVGDALDRATALRGDDIARVRAAAHRAVTLITSAEA